MRPEERSIPPREIVNQTLRKKLIVDGTVEKYPITNHLFKAMRKFAKAEEIFEFDQL